MDKSQYKAQMNDIIQISVKTYIKVESNQKEVMGYKIINSLLDGFAPYNKKSQFAMIPIR